MAALPPPGFFGKLFTLGDFVDRRLPRDLTEAFDRWLQAGLAASREQLGADWLDAYMNSPIWRFGLGPGIGGPQAWAGVLMPSVDKVGRQYPLILAAPLAAAEDLPHVFAAAEGAAWFDALERLALSCLDDDFELDAFDARLQACPAPRFAPAALPLASTGPAAEAGRFAVHVALHDLGQVHAALLDAGAALLRRCLPTYSLWSSGGGQGGAAALLLVEGLPPAEAYAGLLAGHWSPRGWALHSAAARLAGPSPPEPSPELLTEPLTAPLAEPAHWLSWGLSVVGLKRASNEDALLERPADGLWAVADGMGGHEAGEVASQAVVAALAGVAAADDLAVFAERAAQALHGANSRLYRLAQDSGEAGQLIGSTVVAWLAVGGRGVFLWAGDSRLYRFRAGQLRQLSQDHCLYDDGPAGHCNVITRAVGAAETLVLDRGECAALIGDLYLLCSDGLDKELSREDIEAVCREKPPTEIVGELIRRAEASGARDNVTVIVAGLFAGPA